MHLPRFFGKIKVTLETKVNPAFIKQKQMEDFDFKSACFFFLFSWSVHWIAEIEKAGPRQRSMKNFRV